MGQGRNRLLCTNRLRILDTCSAPQRGSRTRSCACFPVSGLTWKTHGSAGLGAGASASLTVISLVQLFYSTEAPPWRQRGRKRSRTSSLTPDILVHGCPDFRAPVAGLHDLAARGSNCNIHFSFWEMLLWDLLEGLCPHGSVSPQPLWSSTRPGSSRAPPVPRLRVLAQTPPFTSSEGRHFRC